MSEFSSDILDRNYDEDGNELDKHGFKLKKYPDGLESVRKSVENCEQMWKQYNSRGCENIAKEILRCISVQIRQQRQ